MKFGLQLYTLRDSYKTAEEFLAVLKKVKALGIDGVEFAGYAGLSAEELKATLAEIGLLPLASHNSVDALENDLAAVLSYNHTLGCKNVVCAFSPTSTAGDMERLERVLKAAQLEAEKYGIRVLYHNHSHEFVSMEKGVPIDLIKDYCLLELDTYWVFNSRTDVRDFMLKNAEKIGLIHLKDGDLDSHPCAIGEGKNDIQTILDTATEIGAEWLLVENDNPVPDGLSDVARSMQNLKTRYTFK